MNQDLKARGSAWLQQHRGDIVRDIFTLSRIPSVKGAPAPGAPFGKACRDALDEAVALCGRRGVDAAINRDGSYALMHYGDGEKSIGIFGHLDVVPEGNDWRLTEPFEPIEREDCLIGRGVSDNKGGGVAGLYAIMALRELGVPLKSRLTLFLGTDEETGMDDVQLFAKEEKMPDFSLVPDVEYPVCHGEKGIFKVYAVCDQKSEALLSFEGGVAINVVCDEARATLREEPALAAELATLCAASKWMEYRVDGGIITVIAKGIAAHASTPDGSRNATHELAKTLAACTKLPEGDRKAMGKLVAVLGDSYGEAIGIAASDELSGRLTCANGIAQMRDGRVAVSFDVRYCVSLDGEQVLKGFETCFKPDGWHLEDVTYSNGYHIPKEDERVQLLMRVYREVSGDTEAQPYTMGGGTYARRLKNAVPYGPEPKIEKRPDFMPPHHGGAHQPDEMLDLPTYLKGIEIFALALVELDAMLNA